MLEFGYITPMIKRFFVSLLKSILNHNVGALAAIIAFFGFSSLLPVLALLMFVAMLIVPETFVDTFVRHVLQSYVPVLPSGQSFALNTVEHLVTFRTHLRIISMVGLFWSSVGGFLTLQRILDTIYEVRKRRSFLKQYVFGFVMLGILLAILFASSAVSAVAPMVLTLFIPRGLSNALVLPVIHGVAKATFALILFVTCFCCYWILPSRKLRVTSTLVGALFSTVIIYVSRSLFVIYTHHLGNYELMYGAMTFVMLLTFWIYIACVIFLIGAEVAVSFNSLLDEMGSRQKRSRLSSQHASHHVPSRPRAFGWPLRKRQP